MQINDVIEIQGVIKAMHGCESKHIKSVPVKEEFEGRTAWEGRVEVFELIDCQKAKRAYGWLFQDGGKDNFIVVLEIPPVDSPQSAVKISIAAKGRQQNPQTHGN